MKKHGFTVTELLVVIAVIILLMSILVVAVMRSRASARNLDCKNNLKQIAVSNMLYIDARRMSPFDVRAGGKGYTSLLPFLEIDLPANADERSVPSILKCPDDPITTRFISYPPCGGRTHAANSKETVGFANARLTDYGKIPDGSSNTVFFSERLPYALVENDFKQYVGRTQVLVRDFVDSEEEFDTRCEELYRSQAYNVLSHNSPVIVLGGGTAFGTKYTPNSKSCTCTPPSLPPSLILREVVSLTASSSHMGFVNASFGDGSVISISDEIDAAVWLSQGTVSGRELTAE